MKRGRRDRAPELPPGINPVRVDEMLERVIGRFREAEPDADESTLRERAEEAVARLFAGGHLEWWGLSEDGEPIYVPVPTARRSQLVVVIW